MTAKLKTAAFTARTCLARSFAPPPRASFVHNGIRCLSSTAPRRSAFAVNDLTQVFHDVAPLRKFRRELLLNSRTVGLVPTMGALHSGHLSLVRTAAAENTDVWVTIYVNPTQFGLNEDLASYPKTWETDMEMLRELDRELAREGKGRISAVFAPSTNTMYPTSPPDSSIPGVGSFIEMRPLGQLLEGASRPVFFRGVATVCMKLFNICTPDSVYFGQKDAQQTVVIKKLEVELEELGVQLDHLPVDGGQRLDVDGVRLRGVEVQLDADLLALAQPDQAREGGVDLDGGDVLLAGGGAVAQPIPVHDGGQPALALHARPAHEQRLLRGGIARVRGARRRRLAVQELDDDVLGNLQRMCQRARRAMAEGAYRIGIHKHRDQRRGQVDEAVLQRRLQRDLGLDDAARRLLRGHGRSSPAEATSAPIEAAAAGRTPTSPPAAPANGRPAQDNGPTRRAGA
ncbi:hypothetical protein OPT61_g8853 [Boeremia exigua]|uniref:Uncharacterized protein n=1 Tax=Boeremia exigua TaxID=749465 RepID=A0ACC2HWL8_9PLEO|nr:hypothetical protein OPT61_g8853 [Boeremia exigua]